MSYYGVYDAEINYVVCTSCKEETFAWLADMFRCTTCGGSDFASPSGLAIGLGKCGQTGDEADIGSSSANTIRKRKRTGSDEDSMRE